MLILVITFNGLSVFAYLLWVVVCGWLVCLVLTVYALYRQKPLAALNDNSLKTDRAPLVSILVAARNEEHRVLDKSMRSVLAQDYGQFEVIAVNDRSTDATGSILNSIAQTDHRLRSI